MGKRDLKKYLAGLDSEQMAEQILELYEKFPDVKTYYDFVFNPREEKLIGEAKAKIRNEYFPQRSKRAKLRRSTAQKFIKHFLSLGVDPIALSDLMLFNLEVAQRYTEKREIRYASFYKSMLNSYEQAGNFVLSQGLFHDFRDRLEIIRNDAKKLHWENWTDFDSAWRTFSDNSKS
ncbi:DUF6155 family protein [Flavobacterium selenitireducens]|uniref:DUF6155 family protein n=1 Tax=Flavobacterium selenitireducens TaxID=2722704 RepID=UPI00168B181D|nr:DUF6155 family protein [Flavobacterium selenitireducens]MBD3581030.1 hypothetical protein [Flavobacterium selenitireducens]